MNIRSIMAATACALAATLIFAAIANGDPETEIIVVVECDDCDELDGYEVTVGENTYVLTLPTPTPTPTPTATPAPSAVGLSGWEPITDENWAIGNEAIMTYELHGKVLTYAEVSNLRYAMGQAHHASFIDACLVNGYEFPPLTTEVLSRWANAEYIGDVSDNRDHFAPKVNPDFAKWWMKLVRSVYRIDSDHYIVASMGVNAEDCVPWSIHPISYTTENIFEYERVLYDPDDDQYVEMVWVRNPRNEYKCCNEDGQWYFEQIEGYWRVDEYYRIGEHILDPLTNHEIETGNIRCRIVRCRDRVPTLDDLRSLSDG